MQYANVYGHQSDLHYLGGTGETVFLLPSSACFPDSCYLFTPVHILARYMQNAKKQSCASRCSALFYNTKQRAVGILQKLKS